jgi:hypothetical protein
MSNVQSIRLAPIRSNAALRQMTLGFLRIIESTDTAAAYNRGCWDASEENDVTTRKVKKSARFPPDPPFYRANVRIIEYFRMYYKYHK